MIRLVETLAVLTLVGVFGFVLGSTLSADAIAMALGIFLGILAALPPALLLTSQPRQASPPPRRFREPDWLDEPELWELAQDRPTRIVVVEKQRAELDYKE
jgi:hypothetical protein